MIGYEMKNISLSSSLYSENIITENTTVINIINYYA